MIFANTDRRVAVFDGVKIIIDGGDNILCVDDNCVEA